MLGIFFQVLPVFYEFYLILLGFIVFSLIFHGVDWILPSFTGFLLDLKGSWFSLTDFEKYYLTLISFAWFHLVLPGFCRVLLDFTGFYFFEEFFCDLPHFAEANSISV